VIVLDVGPLEAARQLLGLTHSAVWHAYFELGGNCPPLEIESHLAGGAQVADREHDMLVHALNEAFSERDMNHPLPYSRP